MPVLNEADYLREAVASVLSQEYEGDKEIVLALGPSVDATDEVAAELAAEDPRVKLVHNPMGRTPIGLNLAIKASSYPIIVRVDAHSELEPTYTARGIETLFRVDAHDVGGLMDARGKNSLQRAVAAAYHSPWGMGGAAYHNGGPEGPAESAYLGIFRREIFDEVGYYDETLWRAQDWELCLRIRQAGRKVWFDPELSTGYYPRDDFKSLAAQSYASGIWRGEIARRYPDGKSLRHDLPPLMVAGTTIGLIAWILQPSISHRLPRSINVVLNLVKAAPVVYAALVVFAAARSKRASTFEKLLLLRVLPTIHFPWAIGFVKGRVRGAQGALDKGRVRS
ncbi:glycosyltransferase family 2 protein [Paeniglutamicibacter sp. Y32M11]|uniref:glycosyltransferase family 2 protein n=1 Tax=Paeniglutamicibacter sp. Y32M11 TaxID=2853258 RepID=UPI001C52AF74|nr:glycosyltransferase family 2 protein [Paeniglutamicibacter sp. Y32M11]QXQ08943.1 glycosyltransferase family 2 protein [Paeniglutamicibacter sp. Y32M11]